MSSQVLKITKDGDSTTSGQAVPVFNHSHSKKNFFLCLNRILCVWGCAHCLLSWHQTLPRRTCLCSLYSAPTLIPPWAFSNSRSLSFINRCCNPLTILIMFSVLNNFFLIGLKICVVIFPVVGVVKTNIIFMTFAGLHVCFLFSSLILIVSARQSSPSRKLPRWQTVQGKDLIYSWGTPDTAQHCYNTCTYLSWSWWAHRGCVKADVLKSLPSERLSELICSLLSMFLQGVTEFCPSYGPRSSLRILGRCLALHGEQESFGLISHLEMRIHPVLACHEPESFLLVKDI